MPTIRYTPAEVFFSVNTAIPVLDARSEGEFAAGHIPGAYSFPILNNEQRVAVGTCYKKQGHDKAVLLGYKLSGPGFHEFIADAWVRFPRRKVRLHCYRGGLRSRILGELLANAGFEVQILKGGYKTYRTNVLQTLSKPLQLLVLGGYTGSGKTEVLHELRHRGEQVLDIEALANHRGSAFGGIGLGEQPTQEQFENDLAAAIAHLHPSRIVWIEDESRMTGRLKLPDPLYNSIRVSRLIFVEKDFGVRKEFIARTYGLLNRSELAACTQKLAKRLGDLRVRQAVNAVQAGDLNAWLDIVLTYYDKTYLHGLEQRSKDTIIPMGGTQLVEQLVRYRAASQA
jgi:tRNA 2-selenouridine synthase